MSYVKVLEWKDGECEGDEGRCGEEMSVERGGGKEVCGKKRNEEGEKGKSPKGSGAGEGGGRK